MNNIKEIEKLQKAEVLEIGDKKYIEMEMALKFTERAVREAVEGFVDYMWKDEKKHNKEVYNVAKHFAKVFLSLSKGDKR